MRSIHPESFSLIGEEMIELSFPQIVESIVNTLQNMKVLSIRCRARPSRKCGERSNPGRLPAPK